MNKLLEFFITDEEYKRVIEFHRHYCTVKYEGACGGKTTFEFTNTNVGQIKIIKCACGESMYISDFSDW